MNDDELGRLRAYADGELDEIEARRVEAELAASPALERALEELQQLDATVSDRLGIDAAAPSTAAAWRSFDARTHEPRARPRLAVALIGIVVALAAVVVAFVIVGNRWSTSTGDITVAQRETFAIGDRAIAVAEAGSTIAWDVAFDGSARVRQSSGAVFYRVEAGDAFVVDTPAGRVTVTGTCFTVELEPMNGTVKHITSAAAGAAVSAAILLTVHEGSVVLANDRGDVEVAAGQRAHASFDDAPMLDDDDTSTKPGKQRPKRVVAAAKGTDTRYQTLVRENQVQREQLRELHEQLRVLKKGPGATDELAIDPESPEFRREVARDCALNGGCDNKLWTDPSEEELVELAKCNRILVDTPSFMAGGELFPDGHIIEAAGLSEEEAHRFTAIAEAYQAEAAGELTKLAAELGLPSTLVDRVDPAQLQGIVQSIVDDETFDATRQRVANERAGLETAPPIEEQSAGERAMRYLWGEGEAFERRLATAFGADAAREMRDAGGGWSNKSSMGDGTCR